MSVVIKRRSGEMVGQVANEAIYRAPNVWAHARAMSYWNKMNVYDQETFKQMARTSPKGMEWIASFPESVAAALHQLHPEIFNDTTGESMRKFLASEEGRPYRVPGNKFVKP